MRRPHRLGLLAAATGLLASALLTNPGAVAATTGSPYGARGGEPWLQSEVGSSWTVTSLKWPDAEPRPGAYDFSEFDAMVDAQAAQGVETQFRVHTCALTSTRAKFWGTYPLPTGTRGLADDPCTQGVPDSQSDWYNFVYQLVAHYRDYKTPVRVFAINNEVNTGGQWPGRTGRTACSMSSCPVFDDYVTTLKTAYSAAHAANPNAIVLDSGLSSPTMGVATTRAKYEAGGKTDTALKAAVTYLNQYFAYRHPPGKALPWMYINPNQPVSQLRAKFEQTFYGTATQQADRFYYFATHMYGAGAGSMDAIQMHFYDYAPYIVNVMKFMRSHGGGTKPIYCWECGIMWPVKDAKLYNYDPARSVTFLKDKARLGFANGMAQMIYLPMIWGSPPNARDLDKILPLTCGEWTGPGYAPGLCAPGSTLSNVGVAFRELATASS